MRIACIVMCWAGALAGQAQVLPEMPEGLELLKPAMTDEERFVTEVRSFDKAQVALAAAERAEAAQLKAAGKGQEAQAKLDSVKARLDLVRKAYEIGIQRFTDNARLHNYYAELLYDFFGDEAKAYTHWNTALLCDSKLPNAYNNLGLYYFHEGKYTLGLQHLDRAVKLDKKNPDYLFNLVQVYMVHFPQIQKLRGWKLKKVYKEAMKLSKKAAELAPQDFDVLYDYAFNFFKGRDFGIDVKWPQAAAAWQAARAQALDATQVFTTWMHEARAWIWAKEDVKAVACLEKALEIYPESEVARNLLQKLRAQEQMPVPSALQEPAIQRPE